MKTVFFITSFLFLTANAVQAKTRYHIQGQLPQNSNTDLSLKGFGHQGDTLIATTKTDDKGKFIISYPTNYRETAVLEIKPSKSVILLLDHENFEIQWDKLEDFTSLKFTHSQANDSFGQGLELYQENERKRTGLSYLLPFYEDSQIMLLLQKGLEVQDKSMLQFLTDLPQDSYATYYLNLRQTLADIPQTASRYIERIPEHEKEFNSMAFGNEKLIRSGLHKQLFEGYFILLESYGGKQYTHMNESIDAIIKSLQSQPTLLHQVAENLFILLEKRSLFPAAEHLALEMLSDDSYQMDGKSKILFEQYRKIAKGNTSPELQFENTKSSFTKLSGIKSKYKLVVFGSSWCPKCTEEIAKIKSFYSQWKKDYDLEVILVSLDNEKEKYETFTKDFPWISSCDLKSWEGPGVRDYYIFGTPTLYLLDTDNKIMLKPISPQQIQAWLEMVKK
ncbi:TlpA family protein disulfide reductase [Flavobacterium xinjiangense]|uniref:Thiol-disulfide isomerase or thioredoxin n=1 Tax=Flavobacterium xinjiangense TaxID=178356 RepID=A0A1M7PGP8_9FLAO|nr:thioredoxin family protein [Flavobacterium xinjiangense]SHN16231.1 Thiol-disulfide isomerase or thioredoxin [Flavobacterium xinjiangense]